MLAGNLFIVWYQHANKINKQNFETETKIRFQYLEPIEQTAYKQWIKITSISSSSVTLNCFPLLYCVFVFTKNFNKIFTGKPWNSLPNHVFHLPITEHFQERSIKSPQNLGWPILLHSSSKQCKRQCKRIYSFSVLQPLTDFPSTYEIKWKIVLNF